MQGNLGGEAFLATPITSHHMYMCMHMGRTCNQGKVAVKGAGVHTLHPKSLDLLRPLLGLSLLPSSRPPFLMTAQVVSYSRRGVGGTLLLLLRTVWRSPRT